MSLVPNKHRLCTRNTQLKKTKLLLDDIVKRHIENQLYEENVLDIVLVNNSLIEVEQLKSRMNLKVMDNELVVDTLSSNSDEANYISVEKYLLDLIIKPKNILIACSHKKRFNDVFTIVEYIHKLSNNNQKRIHITFDEADKNISLIKWFLKKSKKYINTPIITGMLYVTATPLGNFWPILNKEGILTLTTMADKEQYIIDCENYMSPKDHDIIFQEVSENVNDPFEFILQAYNNKHIDESRRVVVFAPGKVNMDSHDDIKGFFIGRGYSVLVLNSANKGFFYPDGRGYEDIQEFKDKYNIKGELYDLLKKWYEVNDLNLAITGRLNLERGITFNTEGFNFTHAIIFPIAKTNDEIQIMGRCCGDKQHIKKMKIICTEKTFENARKYHEMMSSEICSKDHDSLNGSDFIINSDSTIPVKMIINNDELLENIREKINVSKLSTSIKTTIHELILNGIQSGDVTIEDRNNTKKFVINTRVLKTVRKYKEGNNKDANRIKKFSDAFNDYKHSSQTGDKTSYSIDFALDEFTNGDFFNPTKVAWITFRN